MRRNALVIGSPGSAATSAAHVAPRVPEPEIITHAVAELREIERRTGLERTLAIGELVLEKFFGGEPRVWRDRRRNKNNSIRRLASHKDCPFCKSALNDAVGVYVAVRALPCVRTFGHISSSHVTAVLRLPVDERESVLRQAENNRWSVRQLRDYVTSLRRSEGETRGRPVASEAMRLVSALQAAVRDLEGLTQKLVNLGDLEEQATERVQHLCLRLRLHNVEAELQKVSKPRLAAVREVRGGSSASA